MHSPPPRSSASPMHLLLHPAPLTRSDLELPNCSQPPLICFWISLLNPDSPDAHFVVLALVTANRPFFELRKNRNNSPLHPRCVGSVNWGEKRVHNTFFTPSSAFTSASITNAMINMANVYSLTFLHGKHTALESLDPLKIIVCCTHDMMVI